MLPNDWVHTTFEKHIDLLNGFAFKSVNYSSDECDIRLLRGDNIEPGSLRWRGVKRWPANELEKLNKFQLAEHDFVIAMDRTWITSGLKVAEVKQSDLPCLLVQRVSRIRALPTLNQSLLRQYFSGHRFEQYVKSVQTESAVPHISPSQIKEFSFLLPPLPEQRKIAGILSTWDKAISTTERIIDNSKQQKQALMQQLLTGKKRLLDGSGKPFEAEWERVNAGNIFSSRSDKNHNSDLPILAITQDKGAIPRDLIDYKVSVTNASIAGYKVVEQGDFIISLRSFQGGIEYSKYKGICSPAYVILHPNIEITDAFYKYYLKSHSFIQTMKSRLEGIRDGKIISYKYFSEIKLQMPSLIEQKKIAAVLTNADKKIQILEQQLADLKQEKKALMQQLLTGKRRVAV
jgi:type I restriction enzyme S subunit